MKSWKISLIICVCLYVVSLAILIPNALKADYSNGRGLDREFEFREYQTVISNNTTWQPMQDSVVNSSLMTIFVPAIISNVFNLNPITVFEVFPSIFQAFIPVFVYLIARRYMNLWHSLLSGLFIMSQYNFIYNSDIGRMGIGLCFFSIFIWALLSKRYLVASFSTILIVLSHYTTAVITLIVGGLSFLYIMIWERPKIKEILKVGAVIILLVVVIGVWYFKIADATGTHIKSFINSSIWSVTSTPQQITDTTTITANGTTVIINTRPKIPSWFDKLATMDDKEYILQVAFGLKWGEMNYYQKIEWFICWTIILFLLLGIGLAIWRKRLKRLHLCMSIIGLALIALTIFVPYISNYYGIVRVYFTMLVIFAPFFVFGLAEISRMLKINQYILPSVLILLNAIIISGSAPPYLFGLINI